MRQFGNTLVAADTWQLFRARLWWWVGGLGVVVSLVSLWASGDSAAGGGATSRHCRSGQVESQEPLVPLPLHVPANPARVALGERLFHDVRLSGRHTLACATCHRLEQGGADGLPRPRTATGTLHARNTPTIFNVAFNAAYNWDGGVSTIEAHAERVLLSPALMHTTWPALLATLQATPSTGQPLRPCTLGPDPGPRPGRPGHLRALPGDAERPLRSLFRATPTPSTPWNARVRHLQSLRLCRLSPGRQCRAACFRNSVSFRRPQDPTRPVDLGRFLLTQVPRDRAVFRVPSLRNVAVTAPYFHDGRDRWRPP